MGGKRELRPIGRGGVFRWDVGGRKEGAERERAEGGSAKGGGRG